MQMQVYDILQCNCNCGSSSQQAYFAAGQLQDSKQLLGAWVRAWDQFDGLPELFDMAATEQHPLQKVPHCMLCIPHPFSCVNHTQHSKVLFDVRSHCLQTCIYPFSLVEASFNQF